VPAASYERRGWLVRDEMWNNDLQLELAEYRLKLREPA
jgi:hypothetical protein